MRACCRQWARQPLHLAEHLQPASSHRRYTRAQVASLKRALEEKDLQIASVAHRLRSSALAEMAAAKEVKRAHLCCANLCSACVCIWPVCIPAKAIPLALRASETVGLLS